MASDFFRFKAPVLACLWVCGSLVSGPVGAQLSLRSTVEKSLSNNPEVTARLNAYKASIDAVSVVSGGWRPRVDFSANAGRDESRVSTRSPQTQSVNGRGAELSLTQLLWDGLGTRFETQRLSHERLSRYFELRDIAEQTALEATRAQYDVARYRRLVQLAENNYVEHKHSLLQIQSRFKAGVSRGVDFEQANARLALAESNLATEQANLHDVSARYQRVVGEPPMTDALALSLDAQTTALQQGLPGQAAQVVQQALQHSPTISALVEGVRASRAAVSVRDAAFHPRLEARLRAGAGHNFDRVNDQTRSNTAEIVMNWNLYNGNVDQARVRQQVSLLNQAYDLRDKACRDVRQTAEIAFNDTQKLLEQLGYLARNELSIEKARDAYRQQFDIGQRSLLDLLNAENELYTARRAHANAQFELGIAFAKTHAAMNQLTSQLGLSKPLGELSDAVGWGAADDGPGRCPVQAVAIGLTQRSVLDARAQALAANAPQAAPAAPQAAGQTPAR